MNGKIKRTSKINKVKVIELLINRNDYVLKVNVIRLIFEYYIFTCTYLSIHFNENFSLIDTIYFPKPTL